MWFTSSRHPAQVMRRTAVFPSRWAYNNNLHIIIKLWGCVATCVAFVDGRTNGRRMGGRHGRQAASADLLRAGIEGSGGGEPAAWLTRMDGRAGTGNPAAERCDGLYALSFWLPTACLFALWYDNCLSIRRAILPSISYLVLVSWQLSSIIRVQSRPICAPSNQILLPQLECVSPSICHMPVLYRNG